MLERSNQCVHQLKDLGEISFGHNAVANTDHTDRKLSDHESQNNDTCKDCTGDYKECPRKADVGAEMKPILKMYIYLPIPGCDKVKTWPCTICSNI